MDKSAKIGSGQLFVLLILTRIMYTMLYQATGFSSGTPMMLGQLLATGIEALVSLPLLFFLTKETDIFSAISQNPKVQLALKAGYTVFFTLLLAMMLANFADFMYSEFSNIATPFFVVAIIAGVCAYSASLGIEGLARAGSVVFWLVIGLVVSMALLSEGRPNLLYLQPMKNEEVKTMLGYCIEELGSNWWLPMAASLSAHTKKSGWKAGIGYLAFKLLFVEALLFAVTVILWRYINIPGYPILALGAYARTDFIQQFDAVNMFFWTLSCVIVGGSFLYCGGRKKPVIWACAAVSGLLALLMFYKIIKVYETTLLAIRIFGALILGCVLPLAALIVMKIRRKRCEGY